MRPFALSTALALLAPLAAADASEYAGHYFVQDTGAPLVVERLDPVLFPGKVGSHVHSIVGANTFGPTVTYESLQAANCSTVYVKPDKSVYWFPELYFQHPQNKSFIQVPERPEHKIYYMNRANNNETIQEFPQDFRMLAGNAELRSEPTTAQAQTITQWYCHGPEKVAPGFPGDFSSCPDGFAGSIHFPHCWNGNDFNLSDPSAHMSYPMGDHADSGYCPESHPHVMPHIFVEFWFDTSMFNGMYTTSDNPWVLAMGDPTGYGFHADFINGWQTGILGNAMLNCDIGESGAPLSDCFDVYTDDERNACSIAPVVDEVITGWLDALPGCNPIQAGPANAVAQTCANGTTPAISGSTGVPASEAGTGSDSSSSSSSVSSSGSSSGTSGSSDSSSGSSSSSSSSGSTSDVSAADTSSSSDSGSDSSAVPSPVVTNLAPADSSSGSSSPAAVSSAAASSPSSSPSAPAAALPKNTTVSLPSGWSYAGCHTDKVNPRSLGTTGVLFAGLGANNVTSSGCVAYCAAAGYSIAGTEYGGQCFCDNALTSSSAAAESVCDNPCQGDASEVCGGVAALSVFAKGNAVSKRGLAKRTAGRVSL